MWASLSFQVPKVFLASFMAFCNSSRITKYFWYRTAQISFSLQHILSLFPFIRGSRFTSVFKVTSHSFPTRTCDVTLSALTTGLSICRRQTHSSQRISWPTMQWILTAASCVQTTRRWLCLARPWSSLYLYAVTGIEGDLHSRPLTLLFIHLSIVHLRCIQYARVWVRKACKVLDSPTLLRV